MAIETTPVSNEYDDIDPLDLGLTLEVEQAIEDVFGRVEQIDDLEARISALAYIARLAELRARSVGNNKKG